MKPKVGRNFTSERGEGVKGEVKNISLHWLQGIFETVPNSIHAERLCETQRLLQNTSTHFSRGGGGVYFGNMSHREENGNHLGTRTRPVDGVPRSTRTHLW